MPPNQKGKAIVFEFNEDGTIKIEGVGFVGTECDRAMKPFEQALGVTGDRQNKPEYARVAAPSQQTRHNA